MWKRIMPGQVIYQDYEGEDLTPIEKEENEGEYVKVMDMKDWLKQRMAVQTEDDTSISGGIRKR